MFELDPAEWELRARAVDALADALPAPEPLPLPVDRYARALGDAPQRSDAAAANAHAGAVAELQALAGRIRAQARAVAATDVASARGIKAAR